MQRAARREVKAQGTMGTEKARKEGMISQSYHLPSPLTHHPRAPRFAPCGALYEDDRRRIIHNALNTTTQVEFSRTENFMLEKGQFVSFQNSYNQQ